MTRQVWERRVPGTDVPVQRVEVLVDETTGLAEIVGTEATVGAVLVDAGWERAT